MSKLEQAQLYTDGWKCLNCRRSFMKLRIYISEIACIITGHKAFEAFVILIIALNCITLATFDSSKEESETEKNIEIAF